MGGAYGRRKVTAYRIEKAPGGDIFEMPGEWQLQLQLQVQVYPHLTPW
jgi:hypothetical protein